MQEYTPDTTTLSFDLSDEPQKRCSKCHRMLPVSAFNKNSRTKSGLYGWCKECKYQWKKLSAAAVAGKRRWKDAWLKRHPQKNNAHRKVWKAIQAGKLERLPCVVCGSPESEAHHEDYSKPLEVVWFCKPHHREHHKKTKTPE